MQVKAVISLLLLSTVSAQTWYKVNFPSLNGNYTLDWALVNSSSVRFNLSVTGLPTSNWVVNKSGEYMGIGFGNNMMSNVDYLACYTLWSNKSTDAFSCVDGYFDANRNPVTTAETQDFSGLTTVTYNKTLGNFKVSFVRPLTPTDVSKGVDYNLANTSAPVKIIWAHGGLDPVTFMPVQHEEGNNGAHQITLATGANMHISDEDDDDSFAAFFSNKMMKLAAFATVALYMVLGL
ncbi:hypothetical protein FGO68_gene15042 [Halteria grandinella]|uniref:DOMON domain-containing protein n=1 Tax=Halteria grandinella TaxID=5974 RepID=A0A8J8NKF9_HALGN|nr:hypothetical protein FGO68_gene15042 [Halteria grandinella]